MLDLGVMLLIILFAVMGLISGLLMQVLRLVAAVIAVVAALELAGPAMDMWPALLQGYSGARETLFPFVIFFVVYLLLAVLARAIVGLLRSASGTMSAADRLLGGLAGALKGAVLCYFLLALFISAETASGRSIPGIDTSRSIAASFVRENPMGSLTVELERLKQWTGETVSGVGEEARKGASELIQGVKDKTDR